MPTYQYACTACGHQLEAVQSFTDDAADRVPGVRGPAAEAVLLGRHRLQGLGLLPHRLPLLDEARTARRPRPRRRRTPARQSDSGSKAVLGSGSSVQLLVARRRARRPRPRRGLLGRSGQSSAACSRSSSATARPAAGRRSGRSAGPAALVRRAVGDAVSPSAGGGRRAAGRRWRARSPQPGSVSSAVVSGSTTSSSVKSSKLTSRCSSVDAHPSVPGTPPSYPGEFAGVGRMTTVALPVDRSHSAA